MFQVSRDSVTPLWEIGNVGSTSLLYPFSVERSMMYESTGCALERFGTQLHVFTRHVCLYR